MIILFILPSGVEDGQTVRVPVEAGELFVTFRVCSNFIHSEIVYIILLYNVILSLCLLQGTFQGIYLEC